MSLVAKELVGRIYGWQAKAPRFGISSELLALQSVILECAKLFQLTINRCDNRGAFLLAFFVISGSKGSVLCFGCRRTGVATLKCEQAVPKAEFATNGSSSPF